MKVVLASHGVDITSGAERSLLAIAVDLVGRGAQVTVALPGAGSLKKALDERGIANASFDYGWAASRNGADGVASGLGSLDAIVSWLGSVDPDVVFTSTSVIPWFAYAAEFLGKPHAWRVSEDLSSDIGFKYLPDVATTLDFIRTHSDVVFVPSTMVRDIVRGELATLDVRVVLPPMAAEILKYTKSVPTIGDYRIIHSGATYPLKNQLELLRAARALRERRTDFTVSLMGVVSGEYGNSVLEFARDNDMASYVTFIGATTDPYPVMAAHDICVVTSRAEASSRTVAEAMLLRTVVVATDLPTTREKIGDDHALLYPLGDPDALADSLELLMGDRAALWSRAQRAYDFAHGVYFEKDPLAELWSGLHAVLRDVRDSRRSWIDTALLEQSAHLATATAELAQARSLRQRLEIALDTGAQHVAALERQHKELTELIATTTAERDGARGEAADARAATAAAATRIDALQTALDVEQRLSETYERSTSWRVTEPLRAAARGVRRFRGAQ